jgi:hypothetical protein
MNTRQRNTIALVLFLSLVISGCGSAQVSSPTFTPTSAPTFVPTAAPIPTATLAPSVSNKYSDVVKTYPTNAALCSQVDFFKNVLDSGYTCKDVVQVTGQGADGSPHLCVGSCSATISTSENVIKVYGVRVEVKAAVVFDGKTYSSGTKLTVDKDLQWIEVSSWD